MDTRKEESTAAAENLENQDPFYKTLLQKNGIGLLLFIVSVIVLSLAFSLRTSHQENNDQVQQLKCFSQQYDAEIVKRYLVTVRSGGFRCGRASCECCVTLPYFNKTVCVVLKYLKNAAEIEIAITIDGRIAISRAISVKKPVQLCVDIPVLKSVANLCVELYDVKIEGGLSGCARGVVKILFVELVKINFGCFNIPFAGNELMEETD